MGTYIGLVIEGKLIIGRVILRIVTTEDSTHGIVSFMQSGNYGITTLDAMGSQGNVKMILSLVNRVYVPRTTAHLQSINPPAFFSIEDVRYVNEGVFRSKKAKTLSPVCFIRSYDPGKKITSE
jgi:uncharacterized protein YebE (UPF0316 family)